MIRRSYRIAVFGMLGLALGVPGAARAQQQLRVQVDWEWVDAGHRAGFDRAYRAAWLPRVGVLDFDRLYRPVAGVRIPPGYRPRPGFCRLWYPGVVPGHQPRPVRCHRLAGVYRPGVLVVTWQGPMRPIWDRQTGVYWAGYRDLPVAGRQLPAGYARGGAWWDGGRAWRPAPRVRPPVVAGPRQRIHRGDRGAPGWWDDRGRKGREERFEDARRGRADEGGRDGRRRSRDRGR